MADATRPLAPLDPETLINLGPPKIFVVGRAGDLDMEASGWLIGVGTVYAGGTQGTDRERGTRVEIWLTTTGHLVTCRNAFTRSSGGYRSDSQTGTVHETPASAYRWLLEDGKGKLGPASKAAWVQACRTFPPMAGLEVERIEQRRSAIYRWWVRHHLDNRFKADVLFCNLPRPHFQSDVIDLSRGPGERRVSDGSGWHDTLEAAQQCADAALAQLHQCGENCDFDWKRLI